jgi:transcriptional regulator
MFRLYFNGNASRKVVLMLLTPDILTMYIPAAFAINDVEQLTAFIERNSFATLVHIRWHRAFATLCHFSSTANDECCAAIWLVPIRNGNTSITPRRWSFFRGRTLYFALVVPDRTGSADLELLTVHAYGVPKLVDETTLANILRDLVAQYESAQPVPWPGDLPDDFWNRMLKGIVGFEIPISRWEGKWKLSQNRSPQDIQASMSAFPIVRPD